MRKVACLLLIFLIVSCVTGPKPDADLKTPDGPVLIHQEDYGFYIDVPKGWRTDNVTAKKINVPALFIPQDFSFSDAPAIIYAIGHKKPVGKPYGVYNFIGTDHDRYMTKRPAVKMKEMGALTTRDNRIGVLVAYFDPTGGPQSHEVVAYIKDQLIIAVIVLSTDQKEHVATYLPVFKKMVESYNFHGEVK